MPALIMFGRSWRVASDDFVYRGLATLIHRFSWMVAMKLAADHFIPADCDFTNTVPWLYSQICFWLFLSMAVTNIFVIVLSATGTIMSPGPRRHLPKLLYVTVAMAVADFIVHLYGINAVFLQHIPTQCEQPARLWTIYMKIQVVYFLALICAKAILTLVLHYDPLGDSSFRRLTRSQGAYSHRQAARASKIWRLRLMILCGCCTAGDNNVNDTFNETSELLSTFFQNVDLTPSDILAGLILMYEHHWTNSIRRSQRKEPFGEQAQCEDGEDLAQEDLHTLIPPPTSAPPDWMTIDMAFYFSKYMIGIYGWPLYVMMNPCTGIWKLLSPCRCTSPSPSRSNSVIDDNSCFCNTTALRQVAGIDDHDLYLVSFQNHVFQVPFYVAADHVHHSIVVTIRGTMSIRDAITDLQTNSLDLGCPNLPPGCCAHQGMVNAAKFVQKRLEDTRALVDAFNDNPNYNLVIVGHSLGAGTASILGLLLRPTYPQVRCYLYSPPGGLLSKTAAEITQDFQLSIVVGSDLVPRLSVDTLEALKCKLLHAINNCAVPKYWLFAEGLCEYLLKLSWSNNTSQARRGLQQSYEPILPISNPQLIQPGRILHLIEFTGINSVGNNTHWRAYWRNTEDFNEVLVAPGMLTDHLPQTSYKALQKLAENSTQINNDFRNCQTMQQPLPCLNPNDDVQMVNEII